MSETSTGYTRHDWVSPNTTGSNETYSFMQSYLIDQSTPGLWYQEDLSPQQNGNNMNTDRIQWAIVRAMVTIAIVIAAVTIVVMLAIQYAKG